jgi:hypothetical protein
VLLYVPRGPFYSPKASRSRWRPTLKAKLVFCRVVHRTVRCAISFLFWRIRPLVLGVDWRTGQCLVHTGQSGVPNRPLLWATCRPQITRSTVGVGDCCVAELPELFQLKCLSPALEARPHLNGNNPSIPRI